MAEKNLYLIMLFDFFGDLLTERQQEFFDLYYNEDLSLSEIAEQTGVSRQAVHDNLHRAEATLREYEQRTGIVKRFSSQRACYEKAEMLLKKLRPLVEKEKGNAVLDELEDLLNTLRD